MKLKLKNQSYQTAAVEAVADCFKGQPKAEGISYRMDPGREEQPLQSRIAAVDEMEGFKNDDTALPPAGLLKNVQSVQ